MLCCFAPGCHSGYRNCKEVKHFFKPPKDKNLFLKWKEAIPRKDRQLSEKSVICDAHLSDEQIIKADKFIINNQKVEIPRKSRRLKPSSVPHIFPNLSKKKFPQKKKKKAVVTCEAYLKSPNNHSSTADNIHVADLFTAYNNEAIDHEVKTPKLTKPKCKRTSTINKVKMKGIRADAPEAQLRNLQEQQSTRCKEEIPFSQQEIIDTESEKRNPEELLMENEQKMDITKVEIKMEPWWAETTTVIKSELEELATADDGLKNGTDLISNDHQVDIKMEIKEDSWWLKKTSTKSYSKASAVSEPQSKNEEKDITTGMNWADEDLPAICSPRSHREVGNAVPIFFNSAGLEMGDNIKVKEEYCGSESAISDKICTNSITMKSNKVNQKSLPSFKDISEHQNDHKCEMCEKKFSKLLNLKRHHSVHEYNKSHKCDLCGKSFNRNSSFQSHLLLHEGKKPYKCEICEKRFSSKLNLKRHSVIHEGSSPYKCDICGKTFIYQTSLRAHNLVHEGKTPHECEICKKSFTHLSRLKIHLLIHEDKKAYKCDLCGKSFTQLVHLKTHTMVHEDNKPHKCTVCEKRFLWVSQLKTHNRIHEGKRPYKCDICEKTFTQISQLNSHRRIHADGKPHSCEVCNKNFAQLLQLKRHKIIHSGERPHKCEICERSFTHIGSRKRHLLVHRQR